MTRDRRDPSSTRPASGAGAADSREARLRDALRANLHRRKAQARARAEGAPDDPADGPRTENHEGEN